MEINKIWIVFRQTVIVLFLKMLMIEAIKVSILLQLILSSIGRCKKIV